ncbi:hypothetical protein FRACA_20158 [Frankia canadensis]|uniref:Uncharacterized protein n=1 Tax=Frankia canadensis TaxID=1836972 RepID=A0A2I2KQ23_9ACTN|nr:hypothetical protein FRACA_20158 [Frankia canadensis]SOU55052.1 hypothetical protein FRACA_20158 [Frankia canadensis]
MDVEICGPAAFAIEAVTVKDS